MNSGKENQDNLDQMTELEDCNNVMFDARRVFVLSSQNPNADGKAKRIKEAWEKLYGVNTCEVIVLEPDETITSFV